jgi:glucose-6-phosphate dehydrogenase assembly protein OpcA
VGTDGSDGAHRARWQALEAAVRLSLDAVQREVGRLWAEEARRSRAARVELMTIVALVSEPRLARRAKEVLEQVVRAHPSRTILVTWTQGNEASLTAEVSLHQPPDGGPACGDFIEIEAVGSARDWVPQNIDRLILSDLPVGLWWVGDLPDFDNLFDRAVLSADLVVVNSSEMDLRDLEKLSSIMGRSRGRYALADLTWIRLHALQELVARFFDDPGARRCTQSVERVTIEFALRPGTTDVASTQAGLLVGWIANALSLNATRVEWNRGPTWAEVNLGSVAVRFESRAHPDVPPGGILRLVVECRCDAGRFAIERQDDDPHAFKWTREVPGVATPPHTLRLAAPDEPSLLLRCLSQPRHDPLLEASLAAAVRIVRPVAPRFSAAPPNG